MKTTPTLLGYQFPPRVEMYPYYRNGKIEYVGCKQCAIALDDEAHYGDHTA